MIEEPSCPQQHSLSEIIQGVLVGLELEETEVAVVSVKAEDKIVLLEVVDEVPQDRRLDVQVLTERSGLRRMPRWYNRATT